MGNKLSGRDLIKIGFPKNNAINIALGQINRYCKREKKESILTEAKKVLLHPEKFKNHGTWGKVAEGLVNPVQVKFNELRNTRAPFSIFGENEIEEQAKFQLYDALKLPVAVQGALMPDAHSGYGLPIGGVLATDNAVIPYGVGVDIGCRMSLSIFDLPASYLKGKEHQWRKMLLDNTKFGMYETHKIKSDHEVFSHPAFSNIPLVKQLLDKAYKQLGTSGGGNHFVEIGIVKINTPMNEWKLDAGEYVAVLSHSGSRGLGANIAKHYTYLATKQCPLPKNVQHLAWLDMNTHDGQEYWMAMNLAGEYAKACHEDIHKRIAKAIGKRVLVTIENHHNFAWKEKVNGQECIVHRKGATPAAKGELGIIPGSMTAPGFIVRGKGNESSLNSASHGAGRLHSRAKCKAKFTQSDIKKVLKDKEVDLIGGSIDEAPMAYKDIHKVMALQEELVEVLGTFTPKFVRIDK
ncbi:RtcB family protein [Flavobacterium columnare]|uniref:3'-phosphate/5'-hydroxy nucleic acid ligase n=1 Tax=Flavobacterium columnare TaxID=996 RepID=A0AAI8CHK7_9FLAO|nr:RtcB family protein [Flavobacterium columnare]AMO20031.1 RtcB family protein [Flavobacterium columnare]QOG57044.1 RtcB family protein [Flavobacterium columnare]QOG59768.1 RtcB family protein [Flavobacterium columnare]QOG62488.1 RtcB family protein [Flavobacterium columnare]QOG65212.1 RtcB family protein [Flavobacterium columnare]